MLKMDRKIIEFSKDLPENNPVVALFRSAVLSQNPSRLNQIISKSKIPKAELERAFVIACDRGFVNIAKRLSKCDVDISGNNGRNAILHASEKGHLDVVRFLCENGVDVEFNKAAAYSYAATNNHVDIVDYLFQEFGVNLDSGGNEMNMTVLFAPMYGHLEIIRYLHEHDVDIHIQDDLGLSSSIRYGYPELVRYYIENGSDVSEKGEAMLKLAIETGQEDVALYLHEIGCELGDDLVEMPQGNQKQINLIQKLRLKEKERYAVLDADLTDVRLYFSKPHEQRETDLLIRLIKSDFIVDVAQTMVEQDEKLTAALFQNQDKHGNSLITILAVRQQLSDVFKAELWSQNTQEMKNLWQMVPLMYRENFDFDVALNQVHALEVKQQFNQQNAHKAVKLQRRKPPKKSPKL